MSDGSSPAGRRRVLVVVARYLDRHTDYLRALAERVDLTVAVSGEETPGGVSEGRAEGLTVVDIGSIGLPLIEARLRRLIAACQPEVVHAMWYTNEHLVVLARALVGSATPVVYETRDPLTALLGDASPNQGADPLELEREALVASDGQVFVSQAARDYLADRHDLDLGATSIIVPQGLAARTMAEPSPKLSAVDGKVHMALVGTASTEADDPRWYGPLIRRLVADGIQVHSHYFEPHPGANDAYRRLADELDGYHFHPALSDRHGTELSRTLSSYDVMGAFYGLEAPSTEPIYQLIMPAKTASAWVQGAIPLVCARSMRGAAEWIEALGIGLLVDSFDEIGAVVGDAEALAAAALACEAHRHTFTHETSAARLAEFYDHLLHS